MRKIEAWKKTAPFKGARCIWGQQLDFYHKLTSELRIVFYVYSVVDVGGSAVSKNKQLTKRFVFNSKKTCLLEA